MRTPITPRVAACCILMSGLILAGCGSSSGAIYNPAAQSQVIRRTTVSVETINNAAGPSADIVVNGDPQGFAPVRLRLPVDEFGNLVDDLEIIVRWDDGRSESYFRLTAGSRPDPVVRFSPGSSSATF